MTNPRLMSTSGVTRETVWTMDGGPLFLGRDLSNHAALEDPAVSRKHCSLSEVSNGVFEVADLDSHNGTFVNGAKITRKTVAHGDRIRIGGSEFIFLIGPEAPQTSNSDSFSSRLKTLSLDPSGLPSDHSGIARMARDLTAFFKIANVVNSTSDPAAMQGELLALIGEVIPAAQGAIVLLPHAGEESEPITWTRDGGISREMHIREELVQQAAWDRCAVYTSNAQDTSADENVLCVPLMAIEKVLGVIYLSSPVSSPAFGEDHACFLSSVSRIVAVTLENLSKLNSLRAENQRLRADVKSQTTLIGESKAMMRVSQFIARVAGGDSTVLLRGESGTVKEVVARAIHTNSSRPDKPFVAINCAAIPEALLESELSVMRKGLSPGRWR